MPFKTLDEAKSAFQNLQEAESIIDRDKFAKQLIEMTTNAYNELNTLIDTTENQLDNASSCDDQIDEISAKFTSQAQTIQANHEVSCTQFKSSDPNLLKANEIASAFYEQSEDRKFTAIQHESGFDNFFNAVKRDFTLRDNINESISKETVALMESTQEKLENFMEKITSLPDKRPSFRR